MGQVKRWAFVLSMLGALAFALPISAFWHDGHDDADPDCADDYDHPSTRCMTKHPSQKLMQELEKSHRLWKAERGAGGGQKGGPNGGGGGSTGGIDPEMPDADTIPVYFHVIRRGTGIANGDVPDSQIDAQIAVLNAAFGANGGRFKFQKMAVDRTTNSLWYTMSPGTGVERKAKAALRKGGPKSLNLYSCSPGQNLLGWATFPWSQAADPVGDGVVIHFASLPGGAFTVYNEGDTATHEVGHWLGLYHTFQGGCSSDYANGGDQILDTAPEASPYYGSGEPRDSCPSLAGTDPIHNYMDYSEDACMFEFTPNQSTRMSGMWDQYRLKL